MDAERIGINTVCLDMDAKEIVKVSNGIEQEDGTFTPTEALALRVVGVHPNGDPIVGFTYRKVRPEALKVAQTAKFPDMHRIRRSRFVGRI